MGTHAHKQIESIEYEGMPSTHGLYAESPYIHTQAGRFYLDNPTFDAPSIAHSMAQLNRYNGHTARPYSVAEHCIRVSDIMRYVTGGNPFEGLMHDASEVYFSDIPAPFKHLFPDVKKFDDAIDAKLRQWCGLPKQKSVECKKADFIALFIEAWVLLPEHGEDFADPWNMRNAALKYRSEFWPMDCSWQESKKRWLERYEFEKKVHEQAAA